MRNKNPLTSVQFKTLQEIKSTCAFSCETCTYREREREGETCFEIRAMHREYVCIYIWPDPPIKCVSTCLGVACFFAKRRNRYPKTPKPLGVPIVPIPPSIPSSTPVNPVKSADPFNTLAGRPTQKPAAWGKTCPNRYPTDTRPIPPSSRSGPSPVSSPF